MGIFDLLKTYPGKFKELFTYLILIAGIGLGFWFRTLMTSDTIENLNAQKKAISNLVISKDTVRIKDTIRIIQEKTRQPQSKTVSPVQVNGNNAVISQNQSGGITTHSVNVNQAIEPAWALGSSEQVNDTLWRAKLTARGRGNIAFYNWNILLTLNTPVIKREDVPGEVTVGPWMPLTLSGGNLSPDQFFIGFSEFKPTESIGIYLYTKEPIKVQRVDVVPERK